MGLSKVTTIDRTLSDLRDCFRLWEIDLFEVNPKSKVDRGYRGGGMVVTYFRAGQWQHVECYAWPRKEINLRQCYLLLDRLRKAEQQGVCYAGLASTTDLATTTPELRAHDDLMMAYGFLGASPDDPDELIRDIFRKKSIFYHPDRPGGSSEKMKRLNQAYEMILKARERK